MIGHDAMARLRFGGGVTETVLHPLVAIGIIVAVLLILALPRRIVVMPYLWGIFSVPLGQVAVLGGLHFTAHQIITIAVLVRFLVFPGSSSARRFSGGFNAIDCSVVLWSLAEFLISSIQWMEAQAVIKNIGDLVVSLGCYLAVRFLIIDRQTVLRTFRVLAAIMIVQGVCMIGEQITHENLFSAFGANSPAIRDGRVRSEGAAGTLYGGTLAAVSIPFFLWLWHEDRSGTTAAIGLAGATSMAFTSFASTAWMAYAAALVSISFWPLRRQMRLIRWGGMASLVGLHLVMNGPVWSLLEKIDVTGGSSSYHRYMLIDNCIRHFTDWWLVGYKYYSDWGFDMWDLCNQFVVAALTGGLLGLVLFVMIYAKSFSAIGMARKLVSGDRWQEWPLWCLGSALFANLVASFGINYVGQLLVCFYIALSCTAIITSRGDIGAMEAATDENRSLITRGTGCESIDLVSPRSRVII
jgi:hypothetical protein